MASVYIFPNFFVHITLFLYSFFFGTFCRLQESRLLTLASSIAVVTVNIFIHLEGVIRQVVRVKLILIFQPDSLLYTRTFKPPVRFWATPHPWISLSDLISDNMESSKDLKPINPANTTSRRTRNGQIDFAKAEKETLKKAWSASMPAIITSPALDLLPLLPWAVNHSDNHHN